MSSTEAPFQLSVDGLADDYFEVHRLRGKEAISEAWHFDVLVTGPAGASDAVESATLGQSATLIFNVNDSQRAFYGIVAAVRVVGVRGPDQRPEYELRIAPKLWLLKRQRRSRIFQNMRVPDVVTQVLLEAGISARWQLTSAYPVRAYCTQYEESAYAFIKRLLAEAGIGFYFAQGGPISDAAATASSIATGVGSAASTAVSSFVGSAAGSLVSDAVSAATPLVPGDTIIGIDDANFYPALGPDDAAALEAATIAGDAADVGAAVGSAVGGLGAVGGAAIGAAGAVAGDVVADVTKSAAPPLYYLELHGGGGSMARKDKVMRFVLRTTVRTNSAMFREYDPDRPMARLESVALSNDPFPSSALEQAAAAVTQAGSMLGQVAPGPVGAIGDAVAENAGAVATGIEGALGDNPPPLLAEYEHHGNFLFPSWSFGGDEAPRMLRQRRRRASIARGESGCSDLGAAHRFALNDHPVSHLDQEYVITSVEHRGVAKPASTDGAEWRVYENAFECAPATMTYVPPRPKRKSVQVALTARVVGPKGAEIFVSDSGQIKVQFQWHREGVYDDKSSCWIRTMHPWGGAGWGVQFIPRVGMEVVVVFEGGDPDKPMVMGALYNGTHPPPFAVPADATRSGWRTQSSPGGAGFNELSFEDAAGSEQIYVKAQKDLVTDVGDHHQVSVAKNQDIGVGENRTLTVAGTSVDKISGDRNVLVEGTRSITVNGFQITNVAHDMLTNVAENHTLKAAATSTVVVGTKEAEGTATLDVYGAAAASATTTLQLTAVTSIRFVCGKSVIEMTPDEIKLDATALTLSGSQSVSAVGKGPGLHLTDDVVMSGKSITIKTPKAQMKLDTDASIKGDTIKLNCDTIADDDDDTPTPPTPKSFQVIVTDAYHEPIAGKPYQLVVEGTVLEGTTGSDGKVEQDVSPTALSGELVVFLDEKGESPKLVFPLKLADVPPIDTPLGVRTRLKNLGYAKAAFASDGDPDSAAIRAFQRDHVLPETGELDDATKSALTERHGH